MIAISKRSRTTKRNPKKVSFASTLYLASILDLLLSSIPQTWKAELRLGLQEALVNAAKHGNNLDPSKTVNVQFLILEGHYWWIISDQGNGFSPPPSWDDEELDDRHLPDFDSECGRGLCILHQIFDQVHWNPEGTQLRLAKQIKPSWRQPIL